MPPNDNLMMIAATTGRQTPPPSSSDHLQLPSLFHRGKRESSPLFFLLPDEYSRGPGRDYRDILKQKSFRQKTMRRHKNAFADETMVNRG